MDEPERLQRYRAQAPELNWVSDDILRQWESRYPGGPETWNTALMVQCQLINTLWEMVGELKQEIRDAPHYQPR